MLCCLFKKREINQFCGCKGVTLRCTDNSLPVQCHQADDACPMRGPLHCHVQDSKTHIPCAARIELEPCRTETHKYAFDSPRNSGAENEFGNVSGDSDKNPKVVDDVSTAQVVDNETKLQSFAPLMDFDGGKVAAGVENDLKIACESPDFWCMYKQADFDAKIESAGDLLVVVDFHATWCGPCKMIAPKLEEFAKTYADKIIIVKVDVDDCEELALRFEISSMPTFLFIKKGETVDKFSGANAEKLEKFIIQHS